jgi:hypothetical protein
MAWPRAGVVWLVGAGATSLAIGLAVFVAEARRAEARDLAFGRLRAAAERFDDAEAVDMARRFAENRPFARRDERTAEVERLLALTAGWSARRARDAAYDALHNAAEAGDEARVAEAAAAFRVAKWKDDPDPRGDQVERVAMEARGWPARRARDVAYQALVAAAAKDEDGAVIQAAAAFLAANPTGAQSDPRTAQVVQLRDEAGRAPARRARDAAYDRLVALMPVVHGDGPGRDREALAAADTFLTSGAEDAAKDRRVGHVWSLRQEIEEAPARRKRDADYAAMTRAYQSGDDRSLLRAAEAFLTELPPRRKDPREDQALQLKEYALEWPNRRARDAAYDRLVEAFGRGDDAAVLQAAEAFAAAPPRGQPDPRKTQVESLADAAREWPNRRARDAAFRLLARAVAAGDDHGTVLASEEFLGAPPRRGDDPRSDQVRSWYGKSFARWFARNPEGQEADRRVGRYRNLTAKYNR